MGKLLNSNYYLERDLVNHSGFIKNIFFDKEDSKLYSISQSDNIFYVYDEKNQFNLFTSFNIGIEYNPEYIFTNKNYILVINDNGNILGYTKKLPIKKVFEKSYKNITDNFVSCNIVDGKIFIGYDKQIKVLNLETLEEIKTINESIEGCVTNIHVDDKYIYCSCEFNKEVEISLTYREFQYKYKLNIFRKDDYSLVNTTFFDDLYITDITSNDFFFIVSLSDGTIRIHTKNDFLRRYTIPNNGGNVYSVVKSTDFYLFAGTETGDIRTYDLKNINVEDFSIIKSSVNNIINNSLIINGIYMFVSGYSNNLKIYKREYRPVIKNVKYELDFSSKNLLGRINYDGEHTEKYENIRSRIIEKGNPEKLFQGWTNFVKPVEHYDRNIYNEKNFIDKFDFNIEIQLQDKLGYTDIYVIDLDTYEITEPYNFNNQIYFMYSTKIDKNICFQIIIYGSLNNEFKEIYSTKVKEYPYSYKYKKVFFDYKIENEHEYEEFFYKIKITSKEFKDFCEYSPMYKLQLDSDRIFKTKMLEKDIDGGFNLNDSFQLFNMIRKDDVNKLSLINALKNTSNPVSNIISQNHENCLKNDKFNRYGDRITFKPDKNKIELNFKLQEYETDSSNKKVFNDKTVTFNKTKNEEAYKSDLFRSYVYLDGLKMFNGEKHDIMSKDGSFSVMIEDEIVKNKVIDALLIKNDIVDCETTINKFTINNNEDIDNLKRGSYKLYCDNLGDNLSNEDFNVYIRFKHSYYFRRLNPNKYLIKMNKDKKILYVRINDYLMTTLGNEVIVVTNDVNKVMYMSTDKENKNDETQKPYYYLPLMNLSPDGDIVTFYTDDIGDFEVVVNGFTLTPNIDYTLVNMYLHPHFPSMILFKDILPWDSKIEINFLNVKPNSTYYYKNEENKNIIKLSDNKSIFINGTFVIYVNNRKLRQDEYNILSNDKIELTFDGPKNNVYIKFLYLNHPEINNIIRRLRLEFDVNNIIDSENELKVSKINKHNLGNYQGIEDINAIGKIYLILATVDRSFVKNQDAVFDCSDINLVEFKTYLNPNIDYDLNYINNDLFVDCNLSYDLNDFTMLKPE